MFETAQGFLKCHFIAHWRIFFFFLISNYIDFKEGRAFHFATKNYRKIDIFVEFLLVFHPFSSC